MSYVEDVFKINGWKETNKKHDGFLMVYENPGWPGAQVLCGGGFAMQGEVFHAVADEWHLAERKVGRRGLGSGGDYELLAKFLNHIGPDEANYLAARGKRKL